jgi:ribonuclease P protein component
MLAAPNRLRRSADFSATVRQGARAGRPNLVVHCVLRHVQEPPRVGLTVGAAVGNSVVRHRVSRQLRALIGPLLTSMPVGTHVVVRALPGAATCGSAALSSDLMSGLSTALAKAQLKKAPTQEQVLKAQS